MGIGRTQAEALIAAIKAGTANRTQFRTQMGKARDILNEWIGKRDMQDALAAVDFAASKQAQFNTFSDGIPDPALDPEVVP